MEDPIVIVDYDANWSHQYEQEKSQVITALGDSIADIQHIGSTSVPGLAGKPVIDMLLGLKQIPPSPTQVLSLENLGYLYLSEFGIPERHYFRRGMPRTHQIHAVRIDSGFWQRHILFRDYLRVHPQAAQEYEALKRKLAVEFSHDRDRYTDSKTPLIEQILMQARAWQHNL